MCIYKKKYPRIVVDEIGWKKSNNGIKQDFEGTDYEVDIVIKKKKVPLQQFFFFATDVFIWRSDKEGNVEFRYD